MALSRKTIVALARDWIGTPYHHQAAAKGAGCDCLGLIRGLYAELYDGAPEEPPTYTQSWGEYGGEELMLEAARRHLVERAASAPGGFVPVAARAWRPGDVLLFRTKINAVAKHCAIASGPDLMIHAYSGIGVRETAIGIWAARVAGIFIFPGVED